MKKLPALKSKEVVKALIKAGYIEHRQKGSHKIFKKGAMRIVVPDHPGSLKKGTLRNIIKQSGFTVDEFVELLE